MSFEATAPEVLPLTEAEAELGELVVLLELRVSLLGSLLATRVESVLVEADGSAEVEADEESLATAPEALPLPLKEPDAEVEELGVEPELAEL